MEQRVERHLDSLMMRYPKLEVCREDIVKAYNILEGTYDNDGKLMIAGNGGSAADSEHIAGELMKRFKIARPIDDTLAKRILEIDPVRGEGLARNLEKQVSLRKNSKISSCCNRNLIKIKYLSKINRQ